MAIIYYASHTFASSRAVRCVRVQAADVDLTSVREAAVLGLQRLEALDPGFSPFQVLTCRKPRDESLPLCGTKRRPFFNV